ncbi:MAG: carbohydrate binding domain-containing protein [Caldilineaceae bacterium]
MKYGWIGLLISIALYLCITPYRIFSDVRSVYAAPYAPNAPLATPTGWISTNPGGGGAFSTVGAGPTGIVVACSDLSGIYVSRNRGQSWDIVGARQGIAATHASSVGFDPVDGNIILVGTDAGIFRSADGAVSFTQVLNNGYVASIQLARTNPQIGYAAYHPMANWPADLLKAQVYKTTDRGLHWQVVSTNLPTGLHILKLAISPLNANVVYALSGKGRFATGPARLYRSQDGGVTWQAVASSLNRDIMDFALNPSNANTLYLTAFPLTGQLQGATYRSLDNGVIWTKVSDHAGVLWPNANANIVRMVDVTHTWYPSNENGNRLAESTDGGQTWLELGGVVNWNTTWRPDHWAYSDTFDGPVKTVGADLSDSNSLWWITSQFVFATFDGGRTFKQFYTQGSNANGWQSTGVDNIVPADVEFSAADPNKLYTGYYDMGCWQSTNRGQSWQNCNQIEIAPAWKGLGGDMMSVVADPSRSNVVWATSTDSVPPTLNDVAVVAKSTQGGVAGSWQNVSNGLPLKGIFMGLSLDRNSPVNQRTLYVTINGKVYKSSDDGVHWALSLDCTGCRYTAVDAFNSNQVYAGGESGLWRSTTGGAVGSWAKIGTADLQGNGCTGTPFDRCWGGVHAIVPDPNHTNWLYVAVYGQGKGLYRSTDGGATWSKLLTDNYLRTVAVTPGYANVLYAGSSSALCCGGYQADSHGVLRSRDGGATWQAVNEALAFPFANVIKVNPNDPALVVLASTGRGIHLRRFDDLAGTPVPTATPLPTVTPTPVDNLLKNGDFSQGTQFWSSYGMTAQADGELCMFFAQPPPPNLWDAGLSQVGIPIKQGQKYELSFEMWSQTAATIKPIVGLAQTPWTNYWNTLVNLPADNLQPYTYQFTMANADDLQAGLYFHVGGHNSPVICIRNVRLRALVTATPTPTITPTRAPTATPTKTPLPTPTATLVSGCLIGLNNTALFTNQRAVTVQSNVPGAAQMQLSNDGSFTNAVWQAYQNAVPWTLPDIGQRIATLVVYARFRDANSNLLCAGLAATDSIIYDVQAPKVLAAVNLAGQLHIQAEDQLGGSGVAAMQISTQSDFADASWQPWQDNVAVDVAPETTLYVRVRDGAGNESATVSTTTDSFNQLYLPLVTR